MIENNEKFKETNISVEENDVDEAKKCIDDVYCEIRDVQSAVERMERELSKVAYPEDYRRYKRFKVDFEEMLKKYGGAFREFERQFFKERSKEPEFR